ncbi:phosphotransferase [Leucobacter sp. GX0328]
MASIPFTLAALATSAVPGLEVLSVGPHDEDTAYATAVIDTDRGELLVRVPRSGPAEVRQSAELLGLAALTEGSRALLPFSVPETLGMTRAGETRAVVSTSLPGLRFAVEDLAEDAILVPEIAKALAAIHDLPTTIAHHGGLPVRSSRELREQVGRLVERAEGTRLLPQTVRERWMSVLDSSEVWDFAPTMVHGSLDAAQLLVADDVIVGIEGWSEFGTGDPAVDFSWLIAAGAGVFEAVVPRYGNLRSAGSLASLTVRARLYRELEVARWLLHGVEAHDQEVVDDAVAMLDRLVDSLISVPVAAASRPTLSEQEVEAMLEETPEVVDHLSETAAYEALDEDRMFGVEQAFVETDAPDGSGTGADAGAGGGSEESGAEASESSADAETDVMPDIRQHDDASEDASAAAPDDASDHPTEPIGDEDIPR